MKFDSTLQSADTCDSSASGDGFVCEHRVEDEGIGGGSSRGRGAARRCCDEGNYGWEEENKHGACERGR